MREIIIDSDTRVYYIYEEKKYYVENKGTTTYRHTPEDTINVLDIVAPTHTVTEDDLISLATTYETLTNLYYTWSDDGSYISTIQLNEFKEHPLAINPAKKVLYIMNTEIIFNLDTNEGIEDRLQYMRAYYKDTLGLELAERIEVGLSYETLRTIYNLLVSYYTPTAYNEIVKPDSTTVLPKYNNLIKLSNYDGTSQAIYTLTCNPNNESTPDILGYIVSLQDRVITLTEAVDTTKVHVGDILTIKNATTYVENYPYYADGDYTVTTIEGNTITVDENFPTPYQYIPPYLNIVAYKSLIEEVSREDNTITCDNNAPLNSFLIGDKIHIHGTVIQTADNYETLTVDGEYTISAIQGHVITVEETPPTNYTYTTGTQPYLYKRIQTAEIGSIINNPIIDKVVIIEEETTYTPIGTALSITNNTILMSTTPSLNIGDTIRITYSDKTTEVATVSSVSSNAIVTDEKIPDFPEQPRTTITLSSTPTITLTNSMPVSILYPNNTEELTTISSVSDNTITVSNTLTNFEQNYGLLTYSIPSPNILITVSESKREDIMPNTSFIVDNATQANAYLHLLDTLYIPDDTCYNNVNQQVEETYPIDVTGIDHMDFLGLYSEVYTNSN